VPSVPEGPLEVTDVTEKTAMLSWKPPKSNGGLPLSGYIIERRDNKRPTWVKVDKVSPDTTTYKANNMLEGNMYNYRIIAENEEGASPALETKEYVKPSKPAGNILPCMNI
jgi:titin